jgi:hypothetical protein
VHELRLRERGDELKHNRTNCQIGPRSSGSRSECCCMSTTSGLRLCGDPRPSVMPHPVRPEVATRIPAGRADFADNVASWRKPALLRNTVRLVGPPPFAPAKSGKPFAAAGQHTGVGGPVRDRAHFDREGQPASPLGRRHLPPERGRKGIRRQGARYHHINLCGVILPAVVPWPCRCAATPSMRPRIGRDPRRRRPEH